MLTRRRFLRSLPCAGLGVVAFAAMPEAPRRRSGTTFIKAVRESGGDIVGLEHLDGEIVEVIRTRKVPFEFATMQAYRIPWTRETMRFYGITKGAV